MAKKCFFCKTELHSEGNNAEPLASAVCCNLCNIRLVIPYRMCLHNGKTPRVRLSHMYGEPQMEKGLEGNITGVDDIGQIHVNWEDPYSKNADGSPKIISTLALTAEKDIFTIV
jgi:hypothetical protein